MRVTAVRVYPVTPKRGLVAFANIIFDEELFVSSIAIHKKLDGTGYRITYPKKGKGYLFHPICKPLSRMLEQTIISEVKTVLSNAHAGHHRAIAQPE